MGRGVKRILHLPHDARRLRAVVAELDPDVLHVHRSDDQWLARFALGRIARPLLVRTWHRDPAQVAAILRRKLARACHAGLCVSREHLQTLLAAGAPRAAFLQPGVDTGRFAPAAPGTALDSAPTAAKSGKNTVLGLIARWKLKEDRGQRAFLEIAQRLNRQAAWKGALIGRGEGSQALAALLAAHPARERLSIKESNADFHLQVAALDVGLVFAVGSDGTSRAAAELLASGVPILVADLPGLRELGEDPACARVLPPLDLAAWTRELERLLENPALLSAMKKAARARAEAVHGLSVRGTALATFYRQMQQP